MKAMPPPRCYYAGNAHLDGCTQRATLEAQMNGKTAKPKHRKVCHTCSLWLLAEKAANIIEVEFESDNEDSVDFGGDPPQTRNGEGDACFYANSAGAPCLENDSFFFVTCRTLACNNKV